MFEKVAPGLGWLVRRTVISDLGQQKNASKNVKPLGTIRGGSGFVRVLNTIKESE